MSILVICGLVIGGRQQGVPFGELYLERLFQTEGLRVD